MNNWKIFFAAAVIFGAGVLTGGLSVNCLKQCGYAAKSNLVPPADTNAVARPNPPRVLSKQFVQSLDETLHLTVPQRAKIEKIIGDGQNQVRKTLQDARSEIRNALAPDQHPGFDDLMKRQFTRPVFDTNAPSAVLPATNPPPAK